MSIETVETNSQKFVTWHSQSSIHTDCSQLPRKASGRAEFKAGAERRAHAHLRNAPWFVMHILTRFFTRIILLRLLS
jgi:hypothetical protein